MSIFDVSNFKNIIFHNKVLGKETTTFFDYTDTVHTSLKIDLEIYDGCLNAKPFLQPKAYMYIEIFDYNLNILEFMAKTENQGYGQVLISNLFKLVETIKDIYKIKKINGTLSFIDYDHWNVLLHFYASANRYISIHNVKPSFSLIFKLENNLSINEIIKNIDKFENKNINFYYEINYDIQ